MSNILLDIIFSEYGTQEIAGDQHNPEVLKYFIGIGHEWVTTDETAWCSAFANWCCKGAGLEYSGKLNARSWLDVGENVQEPQPLDIVVLWRDKKDSWKGHVGFFIRETSKYIYVLGGNQRNQVCIMRYSKNKLLAYKRLKLRNLNT